jgi:hypothetical protein
MPLTIDEQLRDALTAREISTRTFARIAKLEGIKNASQPQLDAAFRTGDGLSNETAEKLWVLWLEIERMIHDFLPFPLDVSNGIRTHASLQIYRGMQLLKGKDGKQE